MPNAVFAGSFDPPTSGHLDVIESALSIFDGLYVVLAINPEKDGLFTIDERIEMLNAMNRFGKQMKVCKWDGPVSYTHLRAHETPEHLVCRLLLEKKNNNQNTQKIVLSN